jgi:hypothetical protein
MAKKQLQFWCDLLIIEDGMSSGVTKASIREMSNETCRLRTGE